MTKQTSSSNSVSCFPTNHWTMQWSPFREVYNGNTQNLRQNIRNMREWLEKKELGKPYL